MEPQIYTFISVFFAFGLCVGSFLNVCIYRIPAKKSVVFPGSACPKCGYNIKWFDNIPCLSWMMLGGKCRQCKIPIPVRYCLIEFLTGILFGFYAYWFYAQFFFSSSIWVLICHLYLLSLLIACTFIDIDHRIIPDKITKPNIVVGILCAILLPGLTDLPEAWDFSRYLSAGIMSVCGAITGGGLLWIVAMLGKKFYKKEVMGWGDIKFMAMVGAFTGPLESVLIFYLAPIVALPMGIFILIFKRRDMIPYGPYLAMGTMLVILNKPLIYKWLSEHLLINTF